MKIVLATNNNHKKIEFSQLFPDHSILTPEELGITFSYEEPHHTFQENSLGKAFSLREKTSLPVLADDSGLCVTSLGYAPGVHSARYGDLEGNTLAYEDKMALLLKNLENPSSGDKDQKEKQVLERRKDRYKGREAFFVCSLVLLFDKFRFFQIQETVNGYIADKPAGQGGFGYDPVFFLPELNKTMAELTPEEKNLYSHRGRAASRLNLLIQGL